MQIYAFQNFLKYIVSEIFVKNFFLFTRKDYYKEYPGICFTCYYIYE